jgi:branched-chain amino acid transport system substrate-binding protein
LRRAAALVAALVAALLTTLFAGPAPARAQEPVTVYSSLPLQGAARDQTLQVVRGMRLALERAGGTAGGVPVRYVSLDDSTRRAGTGTPERASANAVRAARDPTAIAYLGEFNSGASSISLPILNEAGVLQVSPSNTAPGLTRGGPGTDRGEPDRYYPTGARTFGRVVPADHVLGAAAGVALRDLGARRVAVIDDGETYGRGQAEYVDAALASRGVAVVRRVSVRGSRTSTRVRRAVAAVRRARPEAVFYGGLTATGGAVLRRALHRALPRTRFVGAEGVADSEFAGGIGHAAARRTHVILGTLPGSAYGPRAVEVLRALRTREPYALYGFEAMSVALDAIARGGRDRRAVVRAFFATRDRDSVLGRYSIDENGDTTLTTAGLYRVTRGGAFAFARVVDAAAP